jgi:RNA polymerase sigma-70 factor (ECF subfamily)
MLGLRGSSEGPAGPRQCAPATQDARLRSLFKSHFGFIWRLLRRLGVHEAITDDATQQVFMILSNKLDQVGSGKERAFLTGTAIRVASNHRRSQSRRIDVADTEVVEAALDRSPDPEASLKQRRRRQLLDRALDGLPDDLRVALVLSELEELSNPQISELLAVPLGTVASRLRRARARFRELAEALRNECEDDHE